MEKDLDKCKETINIRMQKDVDYDKMTKDERESLVGPERLGSIHKALKKIGVRGKNHFNCLFSFPSWSHHFRVTESQEDTDCDTFYHWAAC